MRAAQDDGTGLPLPSGPTLDCLRLERPSLQVLRNTPAQADLERANGLIRLFAKVLVESVPEQAARAQNCIIRLSVASDTHEAILTKIATALASDFKTVAPATAEDMARKGLPLDPNHQGIIAQNWQGTASTHIGLFETVSTIGFFDPRKKMLSYHSVSWVEAPQS